MQFVEMAAAGEMLPNSSSNETTVDFNCLASGNLSSTNITAREVWQILDELHYGTPIVATVLLIFFVISFIWNLFIIVTFLVKRRLLREPGNILLLNLAVGDFLVSITTLFFSAITEIAREFIFGQSDVVRCRFCNFTGVFVMFLLTSSLHTLTALSVDRFLLLSQPFRYKKIMKVWVAVVIVIVIWVISFIIAILPVAGFGQLEFNTRFGYCIPRFTGVNLVSGIKNYYYVLFMVIEAIIVLIVLAITSLWTYRIVAKFLRANFHRRATYKKSNEQRDESLHHQKQQKQLVKVFGALFLSNIISYTPVIIVVVIFAALPADQVPPEVFIFGWICYLTTPVVHPVIESLFVKDLRLIVQRGKKGLRRASTMILRRSTSLFYKKDLDRANEEMDKDEVTKRSSRKIVFFGNRQQRSINSEMNTTTVSMSAPTESELLQNTPSHSFPNNSGPLDENALRTRPRRITFVDEAPPGPSPPVQTVVAIVETADEEPKTNGGTPDNLASSSGAHSSSHDDLGTPADRSSSAEPLEAGSFNADISGVNHNSSLFNDSSSALMCRQETLL